MGRGDSQTHQKVVNIALSFQKFLNRFAVKDRVANRGHDRSVAEIGLDGASVVAVVASLKSVSVAQHVGTDEKDAQWGILAIAGAIQWER
jgi:hypothetical protein